jgi:hypothetical protein
LLNCIGEIPERESPFFCFVAKGVAGWVSRLIEMVTTNLNIGDLSMETLNWTEIVLGLLTFLSGIGWIVDRRKHKQEVESLTADNRQKNMNLSKMYVDEFRNNIAEPLQREVGELRNEVNQLRYAIQRIGDCPHSASCPVYDELLKQSEHGDEK